LILLCPISASLAADRLILPGADDRCQHDHHADEHAPEGARIRLLFLRKDGENQEKHVRAGPQQAQFDVVTTNPVGF
jgi:hypothetical protein